MNMTDLAERLLSAAKCGAMSETEAAVLQQMLALQGCVSEWMWSQVLEWVAQQASAAEVAKHVGPSADGKTCASAETLAFDLIMMLAKHTEPSGTLLEAIRAWQLTVGHDITRVFRCGICGTEFKTPEEALECEALGASPQRVGIGAEVKFSFWNEEVVSTSVRRRKTPAGLCRHERWYLMQVIQPALFSGRQHPSRIEETLLRLLSNQ